jgi:hypothetical protein
LQQAAATCGGNINGSEVDADSSAASNAGWCAGCARRAWGARRVSARPAYQRNDYLGWTARAKRPETRAKRLRIMLRELKARSGYMTLPYRVR